MSGGGGGGALLAAISSWFTPTVFFLLLNLMVASIFITSSLKKKQEQQTRVACEDDPVQLFRSPSLFDRVKSISFSRNHRAAAEVATTLYFEPPPPSSREEKVTETVKNDEEEEEVEGHVARTMSDTIVEAVARSPVRGKAKKKMMKKSESVKIAGVKADEEKMERLSLRGPATARERGKRSETVPFVEDEAVDAKADDFINRFKQQLKLQRIESILKYRGGMSSR